MESLPFLQGVHQQGIDLHPLLSPSNSSLWCYVGLMLSQHSLITLCTLATILLGGVGVIFSEKSHEYRTLSTVVPCSL